MKARFKASTALAVVALGAAGAAYAWVATPESCRVSAEKVRVAIKASMDAQLNADAQKCAALPSSQQPACYSQLNVKAQQLEAQRNQYVENLYQQCLNGTWVPQPEWQ
ncbi:MAG TPA: hypothetical protein VIN58_22955 [Roseateles sp.]